MAAHRTSIGGTELYYEDHGAGVPVLCVHGFPLSGELWRPTVERLQDGCRLLVPDLRGMGRSAPSAETSMQRYAEDLANVLDAAGEARPVVLVGLSMGGYVAFDFYRRFPQRVRALALVDTRAAADSEEGRLGRLRTAEQVLREGSAPLADDMLPRLFSPAASGALRERWRDIMRATPPAGAAAALRAMAARPDSTATLAALNVPALVVVGADDAITPPSEAAAMQQAHPAARLRVVPRAGHMTPVEQPEAFSELLGDFVRRLPA